MARIELPGDNQWAELLDPDELTRRHIRKVRLAYAQGKSLGEQVEYGREAILTIIVKSWTLEQPIPSAVKDPLDVLDSLPRPVWYVLEKAADDYIPNFGNPADGDAPVLSLVGADGSEVDPPKPSTD